MSPNLAVQNGDGMQTMQGSNLRGLQAVQQLQNSGAGSLFGGLPAAGAQPGGTPAPGGVPNLAGLMGMLNAGGMGGMGGMPAAPPPVANPEEAYATQIQQLVDMVRNNVLSSGPFNLLPSCTG